MKNLIKLLKFIWICVKIVSQNIGKGWEVMVNDKFLMLVNSEHKFHESMLSRFNYTDTKDAYGKTIMVTEAFAAFKKLQKVMNDKYDIAISKTSIHRTVEDQIRMYEEVKREKGEEYANKTVAKHDESEHLLGLAIDVGVHPMHTTIAQHVYNAPLFAKIAAKLFQVRNETKMEMYHKLHAELADCGFILRYTKDKSHITGVETDEYWHIRYVGVERAKEIERLGMCLEEYVDYINEKTQLSESDNNFEDEQN